MASGNGEIDPDALGGLALDHLRAPDLRRLAAIWCAIRDGAPVPERRRFDPLSVPRLMPHLWLLAHDPETGRCVYRLAGEEINAVYGGSVKGRELAEVIAPDGLSKVRARVVATLETPALVHVIGRVYLEADRLLVGERLILPLADETGTPRFALGATLVHADWDWDQADADVPRGYTATLTPLDGGPARVLQNG